MYATVSAFYVGVTSSTVNDYTNKISFNLVNISGTVYNTPYNTLTSTFSVIQSSLYWFHLSAGVPAGSGTNFILNGLNYSAVVYSSAVVYPQDQLTTDTLQYVWPNSRIFVSNNQSLFSSSNLETAFLGFRLDNLFNPLVAFGVQLTQVVNIAGTIKFDRILVNEGNGYNISEGAFITPFNGSYFFSVTGMTSSTLSMSVSGARKLAVCLCDNAHSSTDQVSSRGAVMLALFVNDKVQITVTTSINTVQDGLASFQGFLYSPLFGKPIAWSVSRTSAVLGPIDYLPFNIINANIATCCWNATSNNVTIPTSGIYYIDITSYPCGNAYIVICPFGYGNNTIQVLRNGSPIITIRLANATFSVCVSRSRSTIVDLKAGDELRVKIPTRGCYYSSVARQMAFSGFLLY